MATENRSTAIADRWKLRYDTHFASKQTILRLACEFASRCRAIDRNVWDASVLHSLEFRKQTQAGISAIFEMQSETGSVLGVLDCLFVQSQTPADITVSQWLSIVGSNIELETPTQ